jgi:midasin
MHVSCPPGAAGTSDHGCTTPCTSKAMRVKSPQELAARGQAWALLGGARLALVAPAPGVDPAAKYSLQRAHLLRRLAEELAPELQA